MFSGSGLFRSGLKKMNYIDLFSGVGGFALGAYWAGMKFDNHYFSEVEPYAVELYQKRFPDAIPLGDITKHEEWDLPDGEYVITGGYPCQPFSTAARGRNNATDLWPYMRDVVYRLRPVFTVAENVSFEAIAQARADIGGQVYEISSAALGATDNRVRYWLLSNTNKNGKPLCAEYEEMASIRRIPKMARWQSDPGGMGMDARLPGRMDRLRGLGNAILPQIAELLFRQIKELL